MLGLIMMCTVQHEQYKIGALHAGAVNALDLQLLFQIFPVLINAVAHGHACCLLRLEG